MGWTPSFRNYMKGLKVFNNDRGCWQVTLCFFYWVCDLGQFNRPWLIKNDILMQILILWDFVLKNWNCEVVFLEYLIYFSELIFSNQPLLLRGIHIGSLKISNLFLRYKDGKWIFWKNTKTLDTKRAHSLKLNCEYIWYKK